MSLKPIKVLVRFRYHGENMSSYLHGFPGEDLMVGKEVMVGGTMREIVSIEYIDDVNENKNSDRLMPVLDLS
jgi:hypothetical protein